MESLNHLPVMPEEAVFYLTENMPDSPVIVDATVGSGGHTKQLLKKITAKNGLLIGIDLDEDILNSTKEKLADYSLNCKFFPGNFSQIKDILHSLNIEKINGIILDLGVSSMQLDRAEKGFSFQNSGPLDMRMGRSIEKTAQEIVNTYSPEKLYEIIKNFGEERWARRIANKITEERAKQPITVTTRLAEIIINAVPAAFRRRGKIHPATRTFQAIRMEVNSELRSLTDLLDTLPEILAVGARAVIISFHSLEDRIVKNKFRELKNTFSFKILTKKPLVPKEEEISNNRRARSAKMRVIEK